MHTNIVYLSSKWKAASVLIVWWRMVYQQIGSGRIVQPKYIIKLLEALGLHHLGEKMQPHIRLKLRDKWVPIKRATLSATLRLFDRATFRASYQSASWFLCVKFESRIGFLKCLYRLFQVGWLFASGLWYLRVSTSRRFLHICFSRTRTLRRHY